MPQGEEEAAVKFYGYLLGLEQVAKPPELAPRGGVWFRGPQIEVHLGVEDGFRPATKAHPAFMVEGLDAAAGPAGRGRHPGRARTRSSSRGSTACYVRDPFGNRIELIEPV